MSDREKANMVAAVGKPPVELTGAAAFMDGAPVAGVEGGVVVDGSQHYSVARAEMVPEGQPTVATETGYAAPANRTGRVTILEHHTSQVTTYGAELEAIHMDGEGRYANLPMARLLQINELYRFMTESGTKPTDDPEEHRRRYWNMVHEMVAEAESLGQYVGALAVYGQEIDPSQLNPSPYVVHVATAMTARTGFATTEMFRTGGAQPHTGVSNTRAAIMAGEAMQLLNPLFMAPTLSGPQVSGGVAGNLARTQFTEVQMAHMAAMGVRPDDLSRPYQSWRYLFRRLGSPSSGVWRAPAPDTMESYLMGAHVKLAAGDINNVDRANGWHTDRIRMVLDGSGANTFEACADDPALGNPNTNVPLQMLRAAVFTALERMGIRGADPRLAVASRIGMAGLSRLTRLELAHHASLREVSRYGTDASVYGKKPGEWLDMLFQIAEDAPHTRLGHDDKTALRKMYATSAETLPEVQKWCRDHGVDKPSAQAYFDLGMNNPAVYMNLRYAELRREHPTMTREEAIRNVELDAAKALHTASHKAQAESKKA
jgi:hypothetical protein